MKKKMKALVLMPALLGMAVAPALMAPTTADASLSFSGEMRTRAWFQDLDSDIDALDMTDSFMDHRLRLYGKFEVNENVQVHFRTDLSEATWGANAGFGSGRLPANAMQVDRAFLQLSKNNLQFRAGLQYVGLSPSQVVNSQDEGVQLVINNEAAPIKLFAVMDGDDNFKNVIEEENWLFGAGISPKMDGLSMDFFGAYLKGRDEAGGLSEDRDVYMLGAAVSADAGMATIFGEFNYFDGDHNQTVDAMGLQGYVGASIKVSDTVTVTPVFAYAQAADADEVQYNVLGNDFNGWDPIFDIGTNLSNEKIGIQRPMDWTGQNAGVIGAWVNAKIKVSDKLGLGAGISYVETEDDDVVDADAMGLVAGLTYDLLPNTRLDFQVEYIAMEVADVDNDIFQGGVYLGVTF